MKKYTWTVKPDTKGINPDQYNVSCYSDDCLTSTYFRNEILDFLEDDHNIKILNYKRIHDYSYVVKFETNEDKFNQIYNELITFYTGRFKSVELVSEDKILWSYDEKSLKNIPEDETYQHKHTEKIQDLFDSLCKP